MGDANGTGSVSFEVTDNGADTAPNVNTLSQSVSMTVAAVNDTPVLTGTSALAYTENDSATPINTAITVADADHATLASATVRITGGFFSGEDALGFANDGNTMGNITATYDDSTGVLTLGLFDVLW